MNMIKKVKKFEKWLLLVLISFCVLFTAISIDGMGLASAIGFELDEDNIVNMSVEEIKQIASDCEESIDLQTEGNKLWQSISRVSIRYIYNDERIC